MCGILGYWNFELNKYRDNQKEFEVLMKESYSRGKEASGVLVYDQLKKTTILKSDLDAKKLIRNSDYVDFVGSMGDVGIRAVLGHSRLATHGTQLDNDNNQPVVSFDSKIALIHNGIITNTDKLWELSKRGVPLPVLDTQILAEYYSFLLETYSEEDALKLLLVHLEGSASVAILNPHKGNLVLGTNTGSLYYFKTQKKLYFSSEKPFLQKIASSKTNIIHVKPGSGIIIDKTGVIKITTGNESEVKLSSKNDKFDAVFKIHGTNQAKSKAEGLYTFKNNLSILKNHDFEYDKIYALKRCVKCILPLTTPFISFDAEGVCSYCREHKPITYKGLDELEKIVSKIRKNNGEPDCLAAFSGGRDSAYGLHFLKKELGLQPLAYTYDWGMVTDIARRNQAKILGKLGVEHIVISADITMKRKHIKENIQAWMKDPHMGMVPLFMEGDKQCEFYADRLMKRYNLPVMFFFRGNELEKDEFKTGHCGVKDADPGGVIHHLEALKKVKLLSFYAYRYLKNPSYFNSSFFDTSLAFFTTYIQPHDYVYLWHYVKWDEGAIVNTLRNEYGWETSAESNQTWRTDDGTSAFYNYIYYMGQGFTENDSFRSRQIREGLLDRDTALKLVHEENKPRYEALQWYFDAVGLDGDKVLSVVDNMKKLY